MTRVGTHQEEIDYHSQRAMKELDLGLRTSCTPAANAHMRLSSLHLQRARELSRLEMPAQMAM